MHQLWGNVSKMIMLPYSAKLKEPACLENQHSTFWFYLVSNILKLMSEKKKSNKKKYIYTYTHATFLDTGSELFNHLLNLKPSTLN